MLAKRFERGARYGDGKWESLLVQSLDGTLSGRRRGGYMDLWRAPNGTVHAVLDDEISWCPNAATGANDWQSQPSQGVVWHVDGVADDLVFAYGPSEVAHRWDGSGWVCEPSPPHLKHIHGSSPDLVFGVGVDGLIARWDESGWTAIDSGVGGVFRHVFVVSADEMYAVHEDGLWEGSVDGWKQRFGAAKGDLLAVCAWRDRIWVTSQTLGLCSLDGTQLSTVKDNQMSHAMDPRGDLLLVQPDKVGCTADGATFKALKQASFDGLWEQEPPPHWS